MIREFLEKYKKQQIKKPVIQGFIESKCILKLFNIDLNSNIGRKLEKNIITILDKYTDFSQEMNYINREEMAKTLGVKINEGESKLIYNIEILIRAEKEVQELIEKNINKK